MLRKRISRWITGGSGITLALAFMACAGGKVEQFSATQVTILANGKEVSRHTMNVTPDKVRLEIDAPMEKGMLIMILRKDKGTQWVINPESKTYFERFLKENEWDRALRRDLKVEEENLGTDEVSGFTCTKRRVETTFGMMGRTMTSKATVWVSERIGMPLRTAQENGQVVELRDIKPGRQAGELFEVPEGFEKAENMMKVLGGQSRRQDGGGRKGLRGTLGM